MGNKSTQVVRFGESNKRQGEESSHDLGNNVLRIVETRRDRGEEEGSRMLTLEVAIQLAQMGFSGLINN